MLQYIFHAITQVYMYPFINKVVKISIMGNHHDKTLDYYRALPVLTLLDEEFDITYKLNSMEYIIHCTSNTYSDALEYIKNTARFSPPRSGRRITSAYEDVNGILNDITPKVMKYFGPDCNFYSNTIFSVTSRNISDHTIYIICDDMCFYMFDGDDYVDIFETSVVNLRNILA